MVLLISKGIVAAKDVEDYDRGPRSLPRFATEW